MSLLVYLAIGVAATLAAFLVLVVVRGREWTGFSEKTLWDWLELLVIPLALAAVAFALNYLQSDREQHQDEERAKRERALAADQRRENALRAYMQQMSELMLRGDTARTPASVQQVMRTSTLTTLRQLNGPRKGLVIQFLAEAGLIDYEPQTDASGGFGSGPTVSLVGADLRGISFDGPVYGAMNFLRADLRGADFSGIDITATFESADLRGANFSGARFSGVHLENACITGARFVSADLGRTVFDDVAGHAVDFSNADLRHADLRNAQLALVTVRDARLPKGWSGAEPGADPDDVDEACRKRLQHG